MRIIKLEIQNFRAFYGNHIIDFAREGEKVKQNLLLITIQELQVFIYALPLKLSSSNFVMIKTYTYLTN